MSKDSSEEAKTRFWKEVQVIDAFLLGIQATADQQVAGYVNVLRRDNLRWLGDHMYAYAKTWTEEQQAKGSEDNGR